MVVFSAQVIFLEVYEREAARQKLVYLVTAGLCAYFSHKVDEYGVYFFDPRYYQVTRQVKYPRMVLLTIYPSDN